MAVPLIALHHVTKRYGHDEPVLRDVSLTIDAGETLAVVGPSGSGKSTLLNLIGGLDRPTDGQVLFEQEDLAQYPEPRLAAYRNRQVGFVFQRHHLLPQLTVLENVLVPTLAAGAAPTPDGVERATQLLGHVGLQDKLQSRPGELSGGECQRVAVVRALIRKPRLLLADEPTGSLDGATAGTLVALLVELNCEEQVALVMVTHALPLARRMAKVLELRGGQLTAVP